MTGSTKPVTERKAMPESDPTSLAHGELLYMMHELSRLISHYFDRAMVPHNLTHAQWWALMHISKNEGMSQSDLARIMDMGRAAASKQFERLEAKGWIERRADPLDARVLRVYLLDAAEPAFDAMRREGETQFEKLFRGVSAKVEQDALVCLRRIKANAEASIAD